MRMLIVVLALTIVVGCSKKKEEAGKSVDLKVDPPAPPIAPLPPLPAAKPGPAYFTTGSGLVRYDAGGWARLAEIEGYGSQRYQLARALGRSVVIIGPKTMRLVEDKLVEITGVQRPTWGHVAVDGTLWGIADGKVVRAATDTLEPEPFAFGDPPRGLTIARDGAIWVHTLDRTYVKTAGTWRAVDVPNVTGQVADILRIAAHPTGDLYLVTTIGLLRRTGNGWTAVHTGHEGEITEIIPGPGGRFVIRLESRALLLGDPRGVRPLDAKDERIVAIDDAGHVWSLSDDAIRVRDSEAKLLQMWRGDETSAIAGAPLYDALVFDGGPPLKVGESARGQVSGKIEGSAAGVQVIACSSSGPAYNKEPCEGVANKRTTMTVAGGRFTLLDVPVGPMRFWVKRGRWRDVDHAPCCETLRPDGTFDVGTLTLR